MIKGSISFMGAVKTACLSIITFAAVAQAEPIKSQQPLKAANEQISVWSLANDNCWIRGVKLPNGWPAYKTSSFVTGLSTLFIPPVAYPDFDAKLADALREMGVSNYPAAEYHVAFYCSTGRTGLQIHVVDPVEPLCVWASFDSPYEINIDSIYAAESTEPLMPACYGMMPGRYILEVPVEEVDYAIDRVRTVLGRAMESVHWVMSREKTPTARLQIELTDVEQFKLRFHYDRLVNDSGLQSVTEALYFDGIVTWPDDEALYLQEVGFFPGL